jgi:hypothetical protein
MNAEIRTLSAQSETWPALIQKLETVITDIGRARELVRSQYQDVFQNEENYRQGISKEVMK